MSTDPRYQQAAQMLRDGNKANARQLIQLLLREQPQNADYWYLAAGASDSERQRNEALNRALAIDPTHARARSALTKAGSSTLPAFDQGPIEVVSPIKKESWASVLLRAIVGAAILFAGIVCLYFATNFYSSASTYSVDAADLGFLLRALYNLIIGIALLVFAGNILKTPKS